MLPAVARDDLWIVVPARLHSRRFPGKPLADLAGEPVIRHVAARARSATSGLVDGRAQIFVDTASSDIAAALHDAEVDVSVSLDTPASLPPTGSDRVARFVASRCAAGAAVPRWVVNLQGDEPCIPAAALSQILRARVTSDAAIVTAAIPMTQRSDAGFDDPDRVKVVLDQADRALLFSRAPIPHSDGRMAPWHLHVGVYAYRVDALRQFAAAAQSALERLERLEQLRALEIGLDIEVVVLHEYTDSPWPAVDRPADLERAREYLARSTSP